jgi:nucleoside-triphosphatase
MAMPTDSSNYILAGPIHTGKTTALQNWLKERTDVSGIITPVINGKRVFQNIQTGEQFEMEATAEEKEVVVIGRFTFSKAGFNKAITIIRTAMAGKDWLIIDEIGPLELKGEGFASILQEVTAQRKERTIWVVREHLAEKVQEHFNFSARIITVAQLASIA